MWIQLIHILLAETEQVGSGSGTGVLTKVLYLAAVVMVAFFLLSATRRRIMRSKKTAGLSAQERVALKRGEGDIYSKINELMAELAELSRQINGQIDTRCKKLDLLLQQADRAIERLEQLQGGDLSLSAGQPRGANPTQPESRPENTESMSAAGNPDSQVKIKRKESVPDDNAVPDISDSGNDNKTKKVLDMAAGGMSDVAIARALDRPVGEIQLILSLNGKKSEKNR